MAPPHLSAGSSAFAATFDSGALTHTISNLFIDQPSTALAVRLFGYTAAGSTLLNVELERVDITGMDYVGALVGQSMSQIEDCEVAGTVDGRWYVGGLAGLSDDDITGSTPSATVTSTTGGVTGGLVGLSRASVTDSYPTGVVSGGGWTGGLVGWSLAAIVEARPREASPQRPTMRAVDWWGTTKVPPWVDNGMANGNVIERFRPDTLMAGALTDTALSPYSLAVTQAIRKDSLSCLLPRNASASLLTITLNWKGDHRDAHWTPMPALESPACPQWTL